MTDPFHGTLSMPLEEQSWEASDSNFIPRFIQFIFLDTQRKYFGNVMGVILTPATASANHDCFSMSPWTPLLGNLSTTYRLMTQNPARSSRRAGGKKKPKTILQSDNVLGWAGGGSLVHDHSTGSGWNPVLRSRRRVPVYLSLA